MTLLNFEWLEKGPREDNEQPLLKIKRLGVRLGTRQIFENLDLEIFRGDQVKIHGSNGAGKSTLLNAIMGVDPIEHGEITFNGLDITNHAIHERAKLGMSYLMQWKNVFREPTVENNLRLALGHKGYHLFEQRFPRWSKELKPDTVVDTLSIGQQQKLAVGMIVCKESHLYLLDEPLAGMSSDAKEDFFNFNRSTVIFIEHTRV
ncbi:MAG: ATP-binding cassette domain-containing protein [Colwellia sp.]|nr:ATP-binding cassette domain-containing protein [Colwellia sp.]